MPILPGWNTLDGIKRWASIFTIAGLVALALLVLFDVLAFIYGRREKELSEALAVSQARQRDENERQEQRKNQEAISGLEDELNTSESLQKTTAGELEQSEQSLQSLKKSYADRHLSGAQKNKLAEALSKFAPPRVEIVWPQNVADGPTYAKDFADSMQAGKWHLGVNDLLQGLYGTSFKGLAILVSARNDSSAVAASELREALESIGIEAPLVTDPKIKPGTVTLYIGRKP